MAPTFLRLRICLALLLVNASSCLFQIPTLPRVDVQNPTLKRLGASQHGNELTFSIEVSEERSFKWTEDPSYRPSFLAIKGLRVRLTDEKGEGTMPGAHGPRPHLSSGCCKLELLSPGKFTSMNGEVELDLDEDSACWEVILRENAPAGQLLLGVDLKTNAQRNDAVLPAGRLFLNVALWDPVVLTDHRAQLHAASKMHDAITEMKDRAIYEMHASDNPIVKALKFREACQAMEKLDLNPTRELKAIVPEEEDEVVMNGVHVVKTGTVWQKNNAFLPRAEHQLLGTCNIKL